MAILGCEAIADGDDRGVERVDVVEQVIHRDRGSKANCVVTELLGEVEKVHHAGDVNAIADGRTENEPVFHDNPPMPGLR